VFTTKATSIEAMLSEEMPCMIHVPIHT